MELTAGQEEFMIEKGIDDARELRFNLMNKYEVLEYE
jgi:hypothetical protein